jgi:hypothetical protein
MKRLLLALVLALLALAAPAAPARAAAGPAEAAQAALGWLIARQQPDGSFPGFDAGASADAVFAIAAAGADPNGVLKNGNSPVSYLGTQAASYAGKSTAAAGKLALAVVAAGKNPADFAGQNLLARILQAYNPASGIYGKNPTDHAYALLALASAGQPIPPAATEALMRQQLPDGGWSFDGAPATGSDTNTTALAVQALVAAGARGETLAKAAAYLRSQQNADGGFPYAQSSSFGAATDANSTALSLQALLALGGEQQAIDAATAALLKLQNPDGSFSYQASQPGANDLATAQAIPALFGKPFPIVRASLPPVSAPASLPAPAKLPATSGMPEPAWLLALAAALLVLGATLRMKRA